MAVKNFRKLPSSAEEGKADAVAAAGVVLVNKNHSVDQHHPVCAINGASRLLITGAATPPRLRRGVCSRYNLPMRLALLISLCVLFAAGCSRVSPAEVVNPKRHHLHRKSESAEGRRDCRQWRQNCLRRLE